ncbi:MAG TPA: type II toxin-antitoxin system HipA family toxin [Arachnia sp.]|nr:type II toxin-antitoxin system HipA family toxin [Arachnia sp.]HMT86589.1 type II toxin-antitoxin system HipA family toxin [Arachnia sp.]
MSKELRVYLDGVPVGVLTQTRQGALGFTYDDDYLARPQPTPLSLSMPPRPGVFSARVVRAFLDGLLPDNQAVRERWGVEFGVSANNPFALLRHVGRDAAGAVQILPADAASDDAVTRDGTIDWLSDDEFVALVRELAEHRRDWNSGRITGRWSLAGAQAKVALYRDPESGAWGVPRDSTPTTHIVKPAIEGLDDHHVNEVLCQRTASRLGLLAARSELVEVGDVRAMVSVRYDRMADGEGVLRRLHQEDLCQAMSVHPSQKYQSEGGPGIGAVADLFSRLGLVDRQASAARFFDGLVFNVLIGGTDAHAKNYSLMLSGGRAQLAPLYDLASAVSYPSDRPLQSAMKVGKHWVMREISPSDWSSVGRRLGLGGDRAVERVAELGGALPSALEMAVKSLPSDTRHRALMLTDKILAHAESTARSWR